MQEFGYEGPINRTLNVIGLDVVFFLASFLGCGDPEVGEMSRAGEACCSDGSEERFVEERSAADRGEERVTLDHAGGGSCSAEACVFTFSFCFLQKVMSLPLCPASSRILIL